MHVSVPWELMKFHINIKLFPQQRERNRKIIQEAKKKVRTLSKINNRLQGLDLRCPKMTTIIAKPCVQINGARPLAELHTLRVHSQSASPDKAASRCWGLKSTSQRCC